APQLLLVGLVVLDPAQDRARELALGIGDPVGGRPHVVGELLDLAIHRLLGAAPQVEVGLAVAVGDHLPRDDGRHRDRDERREREAEREAVPQLHGRAFDLTGWPCTNTSAKQGRPLASSLRPRTSVRCHSRTERNTSGRIGSRRSNSCRAAAASRLPPAAAVAPARSPPAANAAAHHRGALAIGIAIWPIHRSAWPCATRARNAFAGSAVIFER